VFLPKHPDRKAAPLLSGAAFSLFSAVSRLYFCFLLLPTINYPLLISILLPENGPLYLK